MKLIADPDTEAYKSLGGFITIGKAFDTEWNWYRFWNFTAFLSSFCHNEHFANPRS